ncbi:unnamed protein product [Mytilus coruscus]|uniref:Uncharacterized protein n=1 Tax=Mytilus coruscus TaxID=42192 RepID=A0A6J7ZZ00_MYTCO|nr:unnamed protein product [Mytilus coruscus]
MQRKKNCDNVHEGRQSGPCVHCRLHERTDRYIHLVQKKESAPEFYTFAKQIYLIEDEGCICRKCEQKLIRKYEQQTQNQDIQDEATPTANDAVDTVVSAPSRKEREATTTITTTRLVQRLPGMQSTTGWYRTCHTTTFPHGNPLLLGDLDTKVQDWIRKVRINGGVINARIGMAAAEAIVTKFARHRLERYGGHITITSSFAKSLLRRMGFVKRKRNQSRKTDRCLPKGVDFPSTWDVTCTETHWSNEDTMIQFVNNVIVPYVDEIRDSMPLNNSTTQKAIAIFDVFKAHRDHHKEIYELNNKMNVLEKKVNSNIASSFSLNTMECLDKTARFMKTHVKLYVQDAIKTQLPDIHCFDLYEEIKKINPTLWNLIYVLTSNEEEEKIWRQSYFSWNKHYMTQDMQQNCRLFPRLYIASCIFHANSSHCVKPLHLLASDRLDKYSNSSSDLLTINSRLGAGISKDTLKRRIEMSSNRTLPSDIIKSLKEPNNLIGEPSEVKYNKFQALKLLDFHESEVEKHQWNTFESLKTYLSYSQKTTEASTFHSIAVLDDPADSKEIVVKTLNILHDRFQIGNKLQYLVVVGDGKSCDHLIKLKAEYGCVLDWVLPYPGDWHILKNILPIFIKHFYDAGLKELAGIYHHGATLKVLTECTKFSVSHRFFCHVWEAILRCQIDAYKNQEAVIDWCKELDTVLNTVLSSCDHTPDTSEKCAGDILDFEVWKNLLQEKSKLETLLDGVCTNFNQWRFHNCMASATFQFWDTFVHTDFMAYLGLYIGIRSRNWNLWNVSLKKLACLFYAFDRHNYLRMIPYHLADLQTFPQSVLDHFEAGCFSVSITGKNYYCVALDEAHEMEINLKTKEAINSFSPTSLATLTHYLPYRAETLHNIKNQLCIEKTDSQYRETNKPFIETEELTIRQYLSELNTTSLFQENS